MTRTRQCLLETIAELRVVYPHWRLGQVVDNLAFWAEGPQCQGAGNVSDEELLRAASEHLQHRKNQNALEFRASEPDPAREELQRVIEGVGNEHPDWQFGQMIAHLSGHIRIYDIEDGELLKNVNPSLIRIEKMALAG